MKSLNSGPALSDGSVTSQRVSVMNEEPQALSSVNTEKDHNRRDLLANSSLLVALLPSPSDDSVAVVS